MSTTAVELPTLQGLLDRVNEATKALQRARTVPPEVEDVIDSVEPTLHAATPLRLEADPYLMTQLWAAAFRAATALRSDDPAARRRQVRIALEQFRHALRDIVADHPYGDDAPVREVLAATAAVLAAPQKALADLLGVSVRQLQRWLADDGPQPSAGDAARIRVVGRIVNQLRHSFTGPGVLAWFTRRHPVLRVAPVKLLGDPLRYPDLVAAATASRSMAG